MQRITLVGVVMGVAVALVTVFSSDALAKKPKIYPSFEEVNTARILEPGDPLLLKSSDLLITTNVGNITCENARLSGPLQNNGLKTDGFLINAGTFTSASAGPCPSTMPLGPATFTIAPPKGGWPGTANTNGKEKVTGPLMFTAKFEPLGGTTVTCTWSATRVKATFNPDGQPIEVRISAAKFKRVSGEVACPKKARLSGDFELSTHEPGSNKQFAVALG